MACARSPPNHCYSKQQIIIGWIADTYGRKSYGTINSASDSLALSGRVVGALGAALAFDYFGRYGEIMLLGAVGFAVSAALLLLLPSPERLQRAHQPGPK